MKKYLPLIALAFLFSRGASAQDTAQLACSACAISQLSPADCLAQLQTQVNDRCAGQGGTGEITAVEITGKSAGGFCFDGTTGGRMMSTHNLVTFTCAAE